MSKTPAIKEEIRSGDWVRLVATLTGGLTCALGMVVILGWFLHAAFLVQPNPDLVPMQFNTALGFLLAGAGLIAATHDKRRAALGCGTAVAALGLLTLFEPHTGIGLVIDRLFFTHDIAFEATRPGPMAPNTAIAFAASGVALMLIGRSSWPIYRPLVVALWGGVLVFIGMLAFFGYLFDVETAYGWGEQGRMPLHTAAGLVLLGTGIFVYAWREGEDTEKNPSRMVFHRRRFFFLGLIMTAIVAGTAGTSLFLLYNAAFEQQRARLIESSHAQARLMEAMAHFDARHSDRHGIPVDSDTAALSQMREAQSAFRGFGETGVICLAKLESNQIKFLLGDLHDHSQHPPALPISGKMAEPMRRALRGESGSLVGLDCRGETVLAAYEPVGTLGFGIVSKIDLAEIRAPFIRAGMATGGAGILLIGLAALLFRRFSNPLIRHLVESEHKYRALFDSASEGVFLLHGDAFVECNEQACRLWACNRADIIGQSPLDFSPPTQPDGRRSVEAAREIFESLASGKPQLFNWRHRRKDGIHIDTEIDLKTIKIEGREVILGTMRDITRQEEMLRTLRLQGAALEAASNAIVITDRDGNITWVNTAFTDLTGYGAAEAIGRTPRILKSNKQDERFYKDLWDTILGGLVWRGELINQRKDGSLYTEEQTITPLHDKRGQVTHFISIKQDITARKRAERKIRDITFYDSLTELPNRRRFQERLRKVLPSAKRRQKLVALISINLDGFKGINDAFGPGAGDQLLREVADRLAASLRLSDTITRSDPGTDGVSISRVGGDEFGVLLGDISDSRNAATVAERLLNVLSRRFTIAGQDVFATASLGIAVFPLDGEDPDTLARNAETAMHEAKRQGGNGWQYYSPAMNAAAVREIELETRLHGALERQEFSLHYQPLRDATGGRLIGAEALLRWTDPETGPVSPAEFIPIAEKTGLIVPIGEWVLRTACAQVRAWQDAGFRPIRLAVNVSGYQFRQGSVAGTVDRVLEETGLSPAHLELELTESALIQNDRRTVTDLNRLHESGISLALDDFGTGFSSLAYLRQFPFDRVKIDRSFVNEINRNPDDARLATAIIAMAHSLDLRVVAEGVETREQAGFLRREGCDELQGYLFSPPVPPEKFVRFLEKEKEDDDE